MLIPHSTSQNKKKKKNNDNDNNHNNNKFLVPLAAPGFLNPSCASIKRHGRFDQVLCCWSASSGAAGGEVDSKLIEIVVTFKGQHWKAMESPRSLEYAGERCTVSVMDFPVLLTKAALDTSLDTIVLMTYLEQ